MNKDLKALYEEKGTIVKDMRELDAKVTGEKRRMSADENTKWKDWSKRLGELNDDIQRKETVASFDAEENESRREFRRDDDGRTEHRPGDQDAEKRSIENYERIGRDASQLPEDQRKTLENIQSRGFVNFLMRGLDGLSNIERRSMQMGSGPQGGFLVAPIKWMDKFLQKKDDEVMIRQWASKERLVGAHSLGYPTLETDPDDFDWTSEIKTVVEDTSLAFGKREHKTNPLSKEVKISNSAIQNSTIEEKVLSRLAYKFSTTEENAFLTGSGHNRPLGVFTASTDGISTARDMSTGNTTSAIVADNLFRVKYMLKGQYHRNAKWLFHRDAVLQIQLLKDSQNQYLWQPGLQTGVPDRLLGLPFYMNEFAPNTFSASKYVGILGDFSYYSIVDSLDMSIKRLNELYARTDQTGYIGRAQTDGMPVLEEAFVRVKLAAS